MSKLEITLKRGLAGKKKIHTSIIQALGLRRVGQTVVHEDNPSIRGMVNKTSFLLEVKEKR